MEAAVLSTGMRVQTRLDLSKVRRGEPPATWTAPITLTPLAPYMAFGLMALTTVFLQTLPENRGTPPTDTVRQHHTTGRSIDPVLVGQGWAKLAQGHCSRMGSFNPKGVAQSDRRLKVHEGARKVGRAVTPLTSGVGPARAPILNR